MVIESIYQVCSVVRIPVLESSFTLLCFNLWMDATNNESLMSAMCIHSVYYTLYIHTVYCTHIAWNPRTAPSTPYREHPN